MTKRSTRRAVPLAIACAWLVCSSPAWAAPASAAATPASAPAEQSGAAASAATQYTVKPGQSLADVAAAATGSHDKTVLARAARAIFDANPSAFMRNDPSLLKLGAVLNVPALDATGAVAKAEAAPASASASASNPAPSGAAASQAAGANASAAPATKPASAPAGAVSSAPASAATGTGASAAAKATAPAVGAASKAAPASAPAGAQHSQPNGAAGEHAWSGAIQPAAPAAPASAPAASGAAEASAPAAGASEAPAASAPAGTSAPKPVVATSAAVPVIGASNPKVSSLQQLLTLKNRVLMELQRHGVGAPQAAHPGAAGSAPAGASASGFAAAPASGPAAVPAPGKSRAAAAANQRFVGASGSGFDLSRNVFPIVGAVVAAIVAALLVVLVALGVSRRRQAAPAAGATGAAGGSAAGVASSARSDEPAQPAAAPAQTADDPIAAEFLAVLARNPTSKRALMGLAAHYAERKNVQGFDEIAQRIYRLTGGRGPNWTHVASIGRQLDPHNSLYALEAGEADELVLSPGEDAGASAVPPSETSHPEPQAEAAAPRAAEVPPDVPPVPQPAPLHETPPAADASHVAHRSAAEEAPGEEVPPDHPGSHEPAALSEQGDGTLPPEAIAALDGLDIGLPPRVGPAGESPAYPPEAELGEPEPAWEEGPAAESAAGTEKSAHDVPSPGASTEHAEESEKGVREAHDAHEANAAPAAPAVSGLGAAPVGRLNLSFDLDLPGAHAREGKDGGEQSDIAPVPQFTPEQLARIARNKLELAAEYIALGDLGGARTLIHEVIESNDTATHDEAHAMLATLAPLS